MPGFLVKSSDKTLKLVSGPVFESVAAPVRKHLSIKFISHKSQLLILIINNVLNVSYYNIYIILTSNSRLSVYQNVPWFYSDITDNRIYFICKF